MSAPNEPGHPCTGDASSGGNGSPAPAAAGQEGSDVPPWQRGPSNRARQQHAAEGGEPRQGSAPSGLDARLNRFMAGGAADPEAGSRSADRTETIRPEQARPEAGPRPEAPHRPEGPSRPDSTGRPDSGGRPDGPGRPESAGRPENSGRPEPLASEIPDLSGVPPRSPQQRRPVERPAPDQRPRPTSPRPATPTRGVEVASRQHRGPVRASMQIRRVDPWSTLKVSLLLSVALFFVWMIAVAFLYLVLGGMGVWSKLNSNVGDLLTSASGSAGGELVSSGTVFGGAALIGLVNIVLLTAAATIGAFIYNLTTDLVGGVEVTLADRD